MRENRRKEMAAYIARRGAATMQELCDAFPVSMNTIRADVAFLEKTGTVEKVYGGVRSVLQQEIPLFAQRAKLHTDAKIAIARQAAFLVNDRDTLFVDAGTTTMHLLDMLPQDIHATIVTGNLAIIAQAASKPNLELIVLPGALNRRTNSVADKRLAVQQSEKRILLCDSAKFGATGLMSYAALGDIHQLITDAACPEALRALCRSSGTLLEIAE